MGTGPGVEVLFLVRHGKAVGAHPDGDRHRGLSTEGRDRITQMVPRATELGFQGDLALSSPYLRAVQTRDLFATVFAPAHVATSGAFTPDADPNDALVELKVWEAEGYRRIAVFTHNPFVTEFAEWFLAPGSLPDLSFHTPTLLALGFEAGFALGRGRPLWILHP